ncbi:hypothetical protein OTU49_000692 [Cherax quadricarinatus]|uniref:Uncharacterized protein n=1 Tax=Cherax quadricarinatus TaxID=27406 RepID=A0AAW0XZ42_CHEQU
MHCCPLIPLPRMHKKKKNFQVNKLQQLPIRHVNTCICPPCDNQHYPSKVTKLILDGLHLPSIYIAGHCLSAKRASFLPTTVLSVLALEPPGKVLPFTCPVSCMLQPYLQ